MTLLELVRNAKTYRNRTRMVYLALYVRMREDTCPVCKEERLHAIGYETTTRGTLKHRPTCDLNLAEVQVTDFIEWLQHVT